MDSLWKFPLTPWFSEPKSLRGVEFKLYCYLSTCSLVLCFIFSISFILQCIQQFGHYMFKGWILWYFKDKFLLLILLVPKAPDGNIWNNSVVMVVPKSQPGDAIKFRRGNDTWWMSAEFLSAAKISLVFFSRPISQLGWQGQKVWWGFFSLVKAEFAIFLFCNGVAFATAHPP